MRYRVQSNEFNNAQQHEKVHKNHKKKQSKMKNAISGIKNTLERWPRWRCRLIHFASLYNQKKDNKFKNKNQSDLPDHQSIWKLDNQGLKEETFIQTDWWGVGQPGKRGFEARRQLVDQMAPHLHADKLGGTTGE